MTTITKSDTIPVLGFTFGKALEYAGRMTLSDWVMVATLVFTVCKIIPAAIHAWNALNRFFQKDKK